ncbi:hypothetical protein J437_LFUL006315 [Ladona fulva]|uniref:Uncharacterized protein n=1 Tax=Ladona fulva TaxID=123851 RepID=A0A8K0K234_LADFU|nr:hypothetical protein J437_LFUL006315 [Ladona fulva]
MYLLDTNQPLNIARKSLSFEYPTHIYILPSISSPYSNLYTVSSLMAAIILAALLVIVAARPEPPVSSYGAPVPVYGQPAEEAAPVRYKYAYHVKDHEKDLDFGHKEERNGYDTMGEYSVLLPDGRTMIVTYKADKHGYRPVIKFIQPSQQNGY